MAGKRECGHSRKTWLQCVNCDLKSSTLSKDLTSNHNAWREALKMAKAPTHKKCGTWAQSGKKKESILETWVNVYFTSKALSILELLKF